MLDDIFGKAKDESLVEKALTHPSYTVENNMDSLLNYERLEFFGDSVLKLFTSKLLYETFPEYPEGELSKIRSILVSDNILAKAAFEIGLDKIIKLGPSEEKQGGRCRESNLACSLEALLGAYYLNGNIKEIEEFIKKYLFKYASDIDEHFEKYNAKDLLQQYTQGVDKTLPVYRTIGMSGPAHKPIFEVEVEWRGEILAKQFGHTKKEAPHELTTFAHCRHRRREHRGRPWHTHVRLCAGLHAQLPWLPQPANPCPGRWNRHVRRRDLAAFCPGSPAFGNHLLRWRALFAA